MTFRWILWFTFLLVFLFITQGFIFFCSNNKKLCQKFFTSSITKYWMVLFYNDTMKFITKVAPVNYYAEIKILRDKNMPCMHEVHLFVFSLNRDSILEKKSLLKTLTNEYAKKFDIQNNYIYNLFTNNEFNIKLNSEFIKQLTTRYQIIFSATNIVKYLSDLSVNNSIILYLRKNKIFNKSRYSRNRQTYRTGAYWCLYVNIIAIIAFYFWFYNFTINFGYMWWLLFTFIASFTLFKTVKYRLYSINVYILEISNVFNWLVTILYSIIVILDKNKNTIKNYIKKLI